MKVLELEQRLGPQVEGGPTLHQEMQNVQQQQQQQAEAAREAAAAASQRAERRTSQMQTGTI